MYVEETERYELGMVAPQEIRWNDKGFLGIQDTKIFYDECNEQRQFGNGFTVPKGLVPLVKEFKSTKSKNINANNKSPIF